MQFTATIMAVHRSRGRNFVFMAKEYYDLINNKSAMFIDIDSHSRYIYDFSKQKCAQIRARQCDVIDINQSDIMFLGSKNTTHMGSTASVLGLRGDEKNATVGNINGIPVHTWTHNLYYPSMKANVTLSVSFAVSNWTFPHCFKHGTCEHWSRPVLLNVQGYSEFRQTEKHEVYLDYYFVDFIDEVDPQAFVPPEGVFCEGFEYEQRETPFLVDQFSLESEIYDRSSANRKIKSKVYYDRFSNVVREDSKVLVSNGVTTKLPTTVTIMDGRDGVLYVLNGDTNQCKDIQSFTEEDKPTIIVPGDNDQTLSVISINELVLNARNLSDFTYIGNRTCRLGVCQVWSMKNEKDMLTELYFLPGKGNSDSAIYIPVLKTFQQVENSWTPMPNPQNVEQHFFNYQPGEDPDWTIFDITDCYEEKYRLRFQVLLQGPYNNITSLNEFIRAFHSAVQMYTSIQSLRMHRFQIDNIEDTDVSVTVTLLEDPKIAGKIGTNEGSVYHMRNEEVYNIISEKIVTGEFKVMYMDDNEHPTFYNATSITKDIISEERINENAQILNQYTKWQGQDVSTIPALSASRIPVDECAKLCEKENTFRCESFSYCRSTGTCKMLMQRIDEVKDDLIENTDCNFYARNYSFDFSIREKVKLKSYPKEPQTPDLPLEECLRKCVLEQYDNFTCSSVDVCQVKGKPKPACFYHRRHILEVPTGELYQDDNCLHFSRQYISEFRVMVNTSIDNDQYERITYPGNEELCAQVCATDPVGCTDFEMCTLFPATGEKTECTLMRLKDGATNVVPAIKHNAYCDHYRYRGVKTPTPVVTPGAAAKTFFVKEELVQSVHAYAATDVQNGEAAPDQTENTSGGYSGGEMGGLAVGTLILGMLLGAITLYFVARRSATSGADQGIVMKLIGRPGL